MKTIRQLFDKCTLLLFTGLITAGLSTLWNVIKDCDHIQWIFAFLLWGTISFLVISWNNRRDSIKNINLDHFKCESNDSKRYSIVLIDDDHRLRTRYKGLFNYEYDIVVIEQIDSIRYLYGFDIVIFDVVKTVKFNKESSLDMIKMLKKEKPYKYVIAISTDNNKLKDCESWVNAIICKTDSSFDTKLKQEIDIAIRELDFPSSYWDKRVKTIRDYNEDKDSFYKSDYINTIRHNPHFNK